MKNVVLFAVVVVCGALIGGMLDGIMGIDWSQYAPWKRVVHTVFYLIDGSALYWALTR